MEPFPFVNVIEEPTEPANQDSISTLPEDNVRIPNSNSSTTIILHTNESEDRKWSQSLSDGEEKCVQGQRSSSAINSEQKHIQVKFFSEHEMQSSSTGNEEDYHTTSTYSIPPGSSRPLSQQKSMPAMSNFYFGCTGHPRGATCHAKKDERGNSTAEPESENPSKYDYYFFPFKQDMRIV